MSPEQSLANFICRTPLSALDTEARSTGKRVLLAVLGTGIAGAGEDGIAELRQLLMARGGTPECTSMVFGDRLPATSAALLNGTMCRALDYCDAMAPGIHAGAAVVPAAFAAAELLGRCTGEQLMTAIGVGCEMAARFNLSERMYDGFDPTGIAVVFGATAAAGRLLELTEAQMVHALALAFNRCGGSFQSHVDGSLAVRLVQGFVAETGVFCAQMGRAGLTGPRNFLDGHYGFRHLYAKNLRDTGSFTHGLGQQWLFSNFVFKKFPSCGVTQGVTEQTLDIVQESGLTPAQLELAEVRMPPYSWKLVGSPWSIGENPRVNAQFSARYCVANAVLRGSSRLEHFKPEQVADPALTPLIERVCVTPDEGMDARGHSSVDLTVRLKDGRTFERHYDVSPGFPGRGLTAAEHRQRFDDCLAYAALRLPDATARKLRDAIENVEALADVLPLWRSIRSEGA